MSSAAELEALVRRLVLDRDVDGLWPLFGRRMGRKDAFAIEQVLERELAGAEASQYLELYTRPDTRDRHRRFLCGLLETRLGSERRSPSLSILRTLLNRFPEDVALRSLHLRFGSPSVPELREVVQGGDARGQRELCRGAIFGLVRHDDHAWLEERVRAGDFDASQIASLTQAAKDERRLSRRLVRCAAELREPRLFTQVLNLFDVTREVVETALEIEAPKLRAAAMRHAHRLREPTAALRAGLRHPEAEVRRAALAALLERPDRAARPEVEALLSDPDPYDERRNPEPIATLARQLLEKLDG